MRSNRRKPSKAKVTETPRGARDRAGGGQVVCLVAYVTPQLAQAAKIHAIEQGSTVSALVADALGEHLGAA
jgi:hypothetical protein